MIEGATLILTALVSMATLILTALLGRRARTLPNGLETAKQVLARIEERQISLQADIAALNARLDEHLRWHLGPRP
jgi:hypothetical protein